MAGATPHARGDSMQGFPPQKGHAVNRDAYVKTLKRRLDKWNRDLDALEVKASAAKAGAASTLRARLADARERRDEAVTSLARVGAASETAWGALKHGTEEAWGRMAEAFGKAWAAFETAPSKGRGGAKSSTRTAKKKTAKKKTAKKKTVKKATAKVRKGR